MSQSIENCAVSDLVLLKITGIVRDDRIRERASVVQSKTNKPMQFELAEYTQKTVTDWIISPEMIRCQFMFPSRFHDRPHISTRQKKDACQWEQVLCFGHDVAVTRVSGQINWGVLFLFICSNTIGDINTMPTPMVNKPGAMKKNDTTATHHRSQVLSVVNR